MHADISTGPEWELKAASVFTSQIMNSSGVLHWKTAKMWTHSFMNNILAVVKTVCHVCHDSIAHALISAHSVFTAL